jgi:hypothetical protein
MLRSPEGIPGDTSIACTRALTLLVLDGVRRD